MTSLINKLLFPGLSRRDRRLRMQIFTVVCMAAMAVGAIVVMGMRHLHHLPVRPPDLFN